MILPAQRLRELRPVEPFHARKIRHAGMTFGCGSAGYDIRIAQSLTMWPLRFALASSIERFEMPHDLIGIVCDKSSWARRGITVQNTVIEPGWRGWLTLEIVNHSWRWVRIHAGDPIAQILFVRLEERTDTPYSGKYQAQANRPVAAIMEPA